MPTTTLPSDAPLREMLEHRRLALRDRRLKHVIDAPRIRADVYESPRSLLDAIAGFSTERAALRRRLGEIERGARSPTPPPGGRARA